MLDDNCLEGWLDSFKEERRVLALLGSVLSFRVEKMSELFVVRELDHLGISVEVFGYMVNEGRCDVLSACLPKSSVD